MSHWSSGLPVCFLSWGTQFQSPEGYLCETGILLLVLSSYIGDPDVIDHCGLVWGGLRPEMSLGCCADNVIIPLDLTQLFCPSFTLNAGPPFSFITDIVGFWGGGGPVESLQPHCIYTMSHWSSGLPVCLPSWGTRVQSPGGYLCETGILLSAMSRYNIESTGTNDFQQRVFWTKKFQCRGYGYWKNVTNNILVHSIIST